MAKGTFRFYEELNDYLSQNQQKVDIEAEFVGERCIKETIEDFNVPPETVDLILVNGDPVDFRYILKDGDRVSVYPVFERLNIQNVSVLRTFPLRRIQFTADADLKDMAQLMRMLGFDTIYDPAYRMADIIEISRQENRIILTKRKELLRSESVTHAVRVCPGTPLDQVKNVMDDLDIKDRINAFSRCLRCNDVLGHRQTKEILDRISPETKHIFEKYILCRSCRKKTVRRTYGSSTLTLFVCNSKNNHGNYCTCGPEIKKEVKHAYHTDRPGSVRRKGLGKAA
jgi:uncharacterized protein